jgi:hypothetical protein
MGYGAGALAGRMDGERPHYTRIKVINKGGAGALYGLGFLGAVVYYLQVATSFWMGLLGIVKALFWPAFLVYEVLKSLHA